MSLGMQILYCTGYVFVSVVACMLDCLFGLTNIERLPLWFLLFERKSASLLGTTLLFAEVIKAHRQFSLSLPNIQINFNSVWFSLASISRMKPQGDGSKI